MLITIGLPAKDLSLLLTVDWLLYVCGEGAEVIGPLIRFDLISDRIRTSVNVLGDGFGCGIISHLTKERLMESDNIDLIRQLKSDIGWTFRPKLSKFSFPLSTELLNAPTSPSAGPKSPDVAHSRARPPASASRSLFPPTPKSAASPSASAAAFAFPPSSDQSLSPAPPPSAALIPPPLRYPAPSSQNARKMSAGSASQQADERRSLLEGSMEFTV